MIEKILSFLRRYSLGRLKILLFTLLIGGLLLDFKVSFNWTLYKKHFEVIRGSLLENTITFSIVIIFIFMIVIDFIDHNRKRKLYSELIQLLKDENISEAIKEQIMEKLKTHF